MDGVGVKGALLAAWAFLIRQGDPQHCVQAAHRHSQAAALNTEWSCIHSPYPAPVPLCATKRRWACEDHALAGVQPPAGLCPIA